MFGGQKEQRDASGQLARCALTLSKAPSTEVGRLAWAPSAGKYGSGTPGWGPFDCPDPHEERSLDPQCRRVPRWDIPADAGPFLQGHSQARSCQGPKLGPLHLLRVVGPETGSRGLSSLGQASALAPDSE